MLLVLISRRLLKNIIKTRFKNYLELFHGGQKYEYDYYASFDFAALKTFIENIGFENVQRYD